MATPCADAADIAVTGVRIGETGGKTRFVIDVTGEVSFRTLHLANPYRVVVDMNEVDWRIGAGTGTGRGAIERYRYGQFSEHVSRLVLDLSGPAVVDKIFLMQPQGKFSYRLVVDLRPATQSAFTETAAKPVGALPAAKPRTGSQVAETESPGPPSPSLAEQPRDRRRVIIDAGHGGVDPGAMSVIGVPEKTIALKIAQAIRSKLQAGSLYHVVMTRERDVFVPLRRRIEIARDSRADLFISIHGDSLGNSGIQGATVYTVSDKASDAEAAALASKENKADLIAGINLEGESPEVTNILMDLAIRETKNNSTRFANYLIPEMRGRLPVRPRSHRYAGFVVLKAPDVPSVLVETGYLSNREDARRLNSTAGREKLATAMVAAINRYFETTTALGY